jgi:hypothetical protein
LSCDIADLFKFETVVPLSANRAYEFLYAWAPLKLVDATGSPGNPIAAY